MKKLLRSLSPGAGRGHSLGLALVLLVLVLVPSACLLWFMNQAVRNERLAVRQRLIEAYRGHLVLAQERLAAYWRQTAGELDTQAETVPVGGALCQTSPRRPSRCGGLFRFGWKGDLSEWQLAA